MKKILSILLAGVLVLALLTGCGAEKSLEIGHQDQVQAEASGLEIHKIGVATYNIQDAQVSMFKEYLDGYIKECFPDVTFMYSYSIGSEDEMMEFLQSCADNGAEGIMFFYSDDFEKEVAFCAEHEMYVIRPSGNAAEEVFEKVADNPYLIGEIGPGTELEKEAAVEMTKAMADRGDSYVILSGGAFLGNAMHLTRTIAFLETLEELYGVDLGDAAAMAATPEKLEAAEGDLKVVICPGYMEVEAYSAPAAEAISSGEYTTVLATIPVTSLMDALNSVEISCGTTDCFSEDNYFGFKKHKIGFVAGKYQSEIGPAFAALYNALTGNADLYRVDGKAFRLTQGFWTADNEADYDRMYALAKGAAVNAYNYEDLYSCVKVLNEEANFEDFKALVEAYSYDECLARRTK